MDTTIIINGMATIEDLITLGGFGYEFVIENGRVTEILAPGV